MGKADELLKRAEDRKAFKEAQEVLKSNNVTLAANDNSAVRLAAANNQPQNVSVNDAINNASPEMKAKMVDGMLSAKENIPGETMKDVNNIQAPLSTPSEKRGNPIGLDNKQLDAQTQSNIETIEQDKSRESPVDKAIAKAKNAVQEKTEKMDLTQQQDKAKTH